jgi:diguanylate cyclase (GGDEF)-like protein
MSVLAADETARLAALRELAILDTAPEQLYDDVVALAAAICEMPIAIINFVDADRQWGKALIGLASSEAPRDASFCARTIQRPDGLMIVEDTHADSLWASNPQVTGDPGIRFYAGAAITTDDGHALGSVCVADTRGPRLLDDRKLDGLRVLARQTASHLKLRRQTIELSRANEQLREMAIKDPLTGLANRAFFMESLELALHQRQRGYPGLLFCDMNGFKLVNDRLGHRAGDQLLQITAQRLTLAARRGDLVARLGGDEFVVLCPGIERVADLDEIAARLTAAIAEPTQVVGVEIIPSVSIGTAIAREHETSSTLLAVADHGMYANKAHAGAARHPAPRVHPAAPFQESAAA